MSKWFVLEGDWGGQIYATIPVSMAPSRNRLEAALLIIDALQWPCNDGGTSCYESEGHSSADGICGGMGGGATEDSLWLHDGLLSNLKSWVPEFFAGRAGLPSPQKMFEWVFYGDEFLRAVHSKKHWSQVWRCIIRLHDEAATILEHEEESRVNK